jgi:putative ABC transport system permease protein
MSTLLQDIRYALRLLAKSPGFAAIVILTLALGIGANTAIFSAVNGILLKPVPYANPSQLVDLMGVKYFPSGIEGTIYFSQDIWKQVREQTPAIAQMALYNRGEYTMTGDAAPELITVANVSSEFFAVLGCKPALGRPILAGDTQPGSKPVAVISDALWKARWGGDKGVLNHTITLGSKNYSIIGVMPPGFVYPIATVQSEKGVWLPRIVSPSDKSEASAGYPVVRLKKGVSLAAANAQLKIVSARMSSNFKGWMSGGEFRASSLETHFGDLDRALLILIGAVGFVLLIACVNVSGLLLARGWARQREIAIREALGASRLRIVRQFLTESILLAIAGGALGLVFAIWGVRVLRVITPHGLPEHGHFVLNANILWFTIAVSLLTGILFGLAPALQATTRHAGLAIRESVGSLVSSSRRPRRLRSGLVVFEIALAVILVIGATLVARSFQKLLSVKLGFRTDHIVTMDADFGGRICDRRNPKTLSGCKAGLLDVLHRMQSISGVQSAAVSSGVPFEDWGGIIPDLQIDGRAQHVLLAGGQTIFNRFVSPDYFRAFGISLLRGRDFKDADTLGSQRVAIVDSAFANKYFGGHALGHRISGDKDTKGNPEWTEIVGIAASVHDTDLPKPAAGEVYEPYAQATDFHETYFIARTSKDPMAMVPALRRAIWSEDKNAPVTDVTTMDRLVKSEFAEPKFQVLLLGSFGAFGLILAMIGIYGVISYGVTQRTHEIGIRMALGAHPANVLRMVVREGMVLAGAGIVLGICGALALGRVLQSLLFEIKPTDPATFAGVAILLTIVALAACWIPARRAMRVEPMEALRYE